MTNIIRKIKEFISYWYFRYQLATELYMVEPWEKNVIHVCYFIIFGLLSYINSAFVLSGVSSLRSMLLPSMTS